MRLCRLFAKHSRLQQILLFSIGVITTFWLQQGLDFGTAGSHGLVLAAEPPTAVSARSTQTLDRLPVNPAVTSVVAPPSQLFLPQNLPPTRRQPALQPAASEQIVTNTTISQEGLTLPSLWWAQQQFGGDLLESWQAFDGTTGRSRRVELVVNQQIWNQQSYIQRYTFINQMGSSAREFGFSTRILNAQGDILAAYACEFPLLAPPSIQQASTARSNGTSIASHGAIDIPTPTRTGQSAPIRVDAQGLPLATPDTETIALAAAAAACTVSLDSSGAGSLSGTTGWFDGAPAIGGDTLRSR